MSVMRIRDLMLPEFFVGPETQRIQDEKINETEYGHEGALDDYLVKGPGEWGYPEELARNGPGDAACVAYRARVVVRARVVRGHEDGLEPVSGEARRSRGLSVRCRPFLLEIVSGVGFSRRSDVPKDALTTQKPRNPGLSPTRA